MGAPCRGTTGECDDCDHTERKFIAAMLARGRDRTEIGDRIEWACGHALIGDEVAEALHVVNGEGTVAPDRSDSAPDGGRGP